MIGITETLHAEAASAVDDESTDNSRMHIDQDSEHKDEKQADGEEAKTTVLLRRPPEDFLLMDEDKDVIVDPVTSTTNRVSFMRRLANRPNNLKLMPSNSRSVTPSENSVDDTETSGSDHVDGKRRRNRISKPLDIGFRNLSYSVKTGLFREEKHILRNINGDFKSGELTAIMGPSGAGKSTLLDVLAGFTTNDIDGSITVNGCERDLRRYRRQTSYIMQDHDLQPMLTVMEAMHFSSSLRVSDDELSPAMKKERIREILEAIALYDARKTRTGQLSGGQKKRLAIALELVTNPPIMFFDEPTSGLDSSTSTQCVSMLKKLALEGRTIVCTIHQPSALVFKMFDHLFAVADGRCIYTGGTENLLPFLYELDLKCPEFHNPSDYLLEVSTNDFGPQNDRLVEKTENGLSTEYRNKRDRPSTAQIAALTKVEEMMASGLMTPIKTPGLSILSPASPSPASSVVLPNGLGDGASIVISSSCSYKDTNCNNVPKKTKKTLDIAEKLGSGKCCNKDEHMYPTSYFRQLSLLLLRTFLILWRDRSLTTMRIAIHLFMAPLIGFLYFGIGNDAHHALNNYKYAFFSIMFLMYTAFSSIIMNFPLELPIITREYFNRWYSLKAYYVAMTLADAPIQAGCVLVYTAITYFMTDQPLEFYRFALFTLVCASVSFVAQSIGIVVGTVFSLKNGAIFGPFFICPFLIFSGFFIQLNDAHEFMHWLFHVSFLKYALEGASLALFGYGRPRMPCDKMYCHFVLPDKFMKTMHMHEANYVHVLVALSVIFLVFRFIAYYLMLYRLKNKRRGE